MASAKAFRNRTHASKERLDAALANDARRFGHRGVAEFIEIVRQKQHATITETYARDLLARAGYQDPNP